MTEGNRDGRKGISVLFWTVQKTEIHLDYELFGLEDSFRAEGFLTGIQSFQTTHVIYITVDM